MGIGRGRSGAWRQGKGKGNDRRGRCEGYGNRGKTKEKEWDDGGEEGNRREGRWEIREGRVKDGDDR